MNAPHYLRMEGVNLSAFIFNSRDLSSNRGAGLMLLEAAGVPGSVPGIGYDELSRGASSALAEVATDDPGGLARKVRDALDKEYPHATFVLDIASKGSDFRLAVENLIAANRWRQMQAASLSVPPVNADGAGEQPACVLDGLGVGRHVNRNEKPGELVGEAAFRKREHGRKAKQKFYRSVVERVQSRGGEDFTGLLADFPRFAAEFEEIAGNSGALGGKLAVFYADGNRFGSIQSGHCTTPDKQKAFDSYIREQREAFLASFLAWASPRDAWKSKESSCLRFETLLWGGDEMMFVMPAALGWSFAARFFEHFQSLNLSQAGEFPDIPLTHAASLVYCQHHAPIDRIKRLAKDHLAEFAKSRKDLSGDAVGRRRNSLVTLVLESFDHLGTSFERAMEERYRDVMVPLDRMILADPAGEPLSSYLRAFARHLAALRGSETFPRGQLRGLVSAMLARPGEAARLAAFDETAAAPNPPRAFRNATSAEKALLYGSLLPLFGDPATLWVQMEELWDYALPES